MTAPRLLLALTFAVSAARAAETKPAPAAKLPPQPHEWLAPAVDLTPPPAEARWGGAWKQARKLPVELAGHAAVAVDRTIVVLGGVSGRDQLGQRDVYLAKVGSDGSLGSWVKGRPLPVPLAYGAAAAANGRVYAIGGSSRAGHQQLFDGVWSAAVKGTSLGEWRAERAMAQPVIYHAVAVADGRLYVLGGFNGQEFLKTLRFATINPDGTLGEWRQASGEYAHPIGHTVLAPIGRDLVVVGGLWTDSQGEHITSLILRGRRQPDGDVKGWGDDHGLKIAARSMRFSLAEEAGATDGRFVYVFGGRDPDAQGVGTVQATWLNPKADQLTRWQFGPELPMFEQLGPAVSARLYDSQAVIVGDRVFVIGGFLFVREPTRFVWTLPLKPYREPDWLARGAKPAS